LLELDPREDVPEDVEDGAGEDGRADLGGDGGGQLTAPLDVVEHEVEPAHLVLGVAEEGAGGVEVGVGEALVEVSQAGVEDAGDVELAERRARVEPAGVEAA